MPERAKAYTALVLSNIIWGSSVVATRIAGGVIPPVTLCFLRFMTASLIMFSIWLISKDRQVPRGRDLVLVLVTGAVGVSVYYMLENRGIMMTSASTAALIAGSYPAITLLLGVLFFHEKATAGKVIGIGLALCGIALLSWQANEQASSALGIIFLLIDGLIWALYNYIVKSISDDLSPFTITFFQALTGTMLFVPFLFTESRAGIELTGSTVSCVLYLGIAASTVAYLLYNYGLRNVSAFAAASLLNLIPVSGTVLSALVLHEVITARAGLGGILVIAGVMISTWRSSS